MIVLSLGGLGLTPLTQQFPPRKGQPPKNTAALLLQGNYLVTDKKQRNIGT
jgi:hypothetical protein